MIRRVERDRLRLHPADGVVEVLQAACPAGARPGRRASPGSRRAAVPVTEFMFAETIGMVAPVPSFGASDDVEPAGHVGPGGDQEHIRVGEIVTRGRSIELHENQRYASPRRRPHASRPMGLGLMTAWTTGGHRACRPTTEINGESGRSAVSSQLTGVGTDDGSRANSEPTNGSSTNCTSSSSSTRTRSTSPGGRFSRATSRPSRTTPARVAPRPRRDPRADPGGADGTGSREPPPPPPRADRAVAERAHDPARPRARAPDHRPAPGDRRAARRPHHLRRRPSPSRCRRMRPSRPRRPSSRAARRRPPPKTRSPRCAACRRRSPANMDASLTVPTATSVRTIPAKLMIDNRIVINNHLKRARGGKVSFTHLIGWALIQALKEFPSQNVYYAEVDGKPSVVAPAHVNLGIAIDLPKPDGTRVAARAEHQARRHAWASASTSPPTRSWSPGPATNKLTAADFAGHHDLADQPGRHRHRALGAPPDEGPGLHHRRRRPRVPGRVPGLEREDPRRASPSARRSRSPAPTTTASSRAPAPASSSRSCTSC